jgi:putative flippase GtrA
MLAKLVTTAREIVDTQPFRYLIAGGINTVLTTGIIWLGSQVMWYQYAYALSYAIGIVLAYYLNTLFVFRTPTSFRTFLQFPLVYVVQYLAGAALLEGFVRWFSLDPTLASLIIVIVLLPLTFVLSKVLLRVEPKLNVER